MKKILKYEYVIILGIIALDAMTKGVVSGTMALHDRITVIKDFFWIYYVHNTGAAFSILEGQFWFFIVSSLVALVLLIVWLLRSDAKQVLFRISLCLLIAGAVGNMMDRMLLGYVRDFLSFKLFGFYYFPVFNVADISLNIGIALMILDTLLEGRSHGKVKL